MRILLTGATGLIGRELGKRLVARGDTLVCLVRDVAAARTRLPFPAACHLWDHRRAVPAQALAGVEAIVNLAGEPIAEARWTDERRRVIRDSRVLGTRRLVAAAMRHGAEVRTFVQGSAIGYYGDRGDEPLDGDSPAGTGFLADLTSAWEAELRPISGWRRDVAVTMVRTGIVLARHGGALAKMLPVFREGAGGRLGRGNHWMSWIHIEDIVGLLLHALDSRPGGILEGVAPAPATNRELTAALARALGVGEGPPVPSLALRALYGEMADVLLASARIEPRRALALGFRFRFPAIDEALADLAQPLAGRTREKLAEQWVADPPERVWPYFCDERNLEELTPDFLHFRVLGKSTAEIGEGTLIDYRLQLNGIPLGWRSRIEHWEPARRFVDAQVKGPYALWRHEHEFVPVAGGTLMRDVVRYRLPLGRLGSAVAGWKVDADVDRIFSHRAQRIAERFAS